MLLKPTDNASRNEKRIVWGGEQSLLLPAPTRFRGVTGKMVTVAEEQE